MSHFDTSGKETGVSVRDENTLARLSRLDRAQRHQDPDRVTALNRNPGIRPFKPLPEEPI
jgi:hypothetical protein